MSACGATKDAISRPIWMYVPRVDAVTILNSAAASAIVAWSKNVAATSARDRIFFICFPLARAQCKVQGLPLLACRNVAARARALPRGPDAWLSARGQRVRRHLERGWFSR